MDKLYYHNAVFWRNAFEQIESFCIYGHFLSILEGAIHEFWVGLYRTSLRSRSLANYQKIRTVQKPDWRLCDDNYKVIPQVRIFWSTKIRTNMIILYLPNSKTKYPFISMISKGGQHHIYILLLTSYGTVVRDFESEAKTRCNFQFR